MKNIIKGSTNLLLKVLLILLIFCQFGYTDEYLPSPYALKMYAEVRSVFLMKLGLFVPNPPALYVSAFPNKKLKGQFKSNINNIWLTKKGFHDELELAGVLAHEYAHAWQYYHCPSMHNNVFLFEGFAMFISEKCLREMFYPPDYGYEIQSYINDSPALGLKGYRYFTRLEERYGYVIIIRELINDRWTLR